MLYLNLLIYYSMKYYYLSNALIIRRPEVVSDKYPIISPSFIDKILLISLLLFLNFLYITQNIYNSRIITIIIQGNKIIKPKGYPMHYNNEFKKTPAYQGKL